MVLLISGNLQLLEMTWLSVFKLYFQIQNDSSESVIGHII